MDVLLECYRKVKMAEDDPVVDSSAQDDQGGSPGSPEVKFSDANFRRKQVFQYGNYNRYYGYRVGKSLEEDPRMSLMQKSWFENKDVIDIGCNEGHITISLAQKYRVRSMCGIDIDPGLINKAWKNLEYEAGASNVDSIYEWEDYVYDDEWDHDDEMDHDYYEKPASSDQNEDGLQGKELLRRVFFKNVNVLYCDFRENIVDTVLCLSVVKWIHLNWGDEGILDFFIRVYQVLRPGGAFILEPQPWSSYKKKKCRVAEVCRQNLRKIVLRPDQFPGILLDQIGFKSCEEIASKVPSSKKGFSRPLYLFIK